ncbi:MAG: phosphatidate cytidylyltransferase [Pirellulales bacterium]|jgi:phosphatidate cytidylyltransferase
MDAATWGLIALVLGLLAAATAVGQVLKRQPELGLNPAAVAAFNQRLRAWWMLCCLLAAAFWFHPAATVFLFGCISFWALREFITLTPTRLGDHRALFWVFFLFTPLQYVLVGMDRPGVASGTYGLFNVLIPVYAFLFVFARIAMAGDYKRFLERTAKIQAGLLVCVYCLSFAPALLYLDLLDADGRPWTGSKAGLLFFFIFIVQVSDALQYAWGRLYGRHVIAPSISSSRTWEGFVGGSGSAALIGMALYWATPFNFWQSAAMSLLISIMAFAGGLTMSAIKRDRGVKDYGTLVEGHGGVLDRIDSICFAAPVFYHITRYFFSA